MCACGTGEAAARGSVSNGEIVGGSLDTAWASTHTSLQSKRERRAGGCTWLHQSIVQVSWRMYIREPIRFGCGGGYRPIRGAHILWAGKRLLSGCPELGFFSIWPSENQRLAEIRCLVVHSVMSYAEMGAQRCPMTTKQRFTAIKQQYTSSRDISQPWGVQPAE